MWTNRRWAGLVMAGCLIWVIGSIFHYGMYTRLLRDGGDAWGYYIYLPSAFVSGDLTSLEHIASVRRSYNPWVGDAEVNEGWIQEVHVAPNGNPVIKYTSGVALMISPFFLIAHALALILSLEANGFSPIYWLSAYLGVVAWVLLGFILLYKTMVRYFEATIVLGSLALIVIGTNLYYFLAYNSPMSHAPLFALYALLIWLSDQFYREPGWMIALGIGAVCGLITMIRPVELICILIPLLWGVDGWKERFRFFVVHSRFVLFVAAGFAILLLPQLFYWKLVTGQWLYYSYGGEGFHFNRPMILSGVFSFMNGWLVYTPLFIIALPGLWYVYKRFRGLFIPIVLFLAIHMYVVYSWHNWYYINSFGSRPMVEAYALLAFPLAGGVQCFSKGWRSYILIPVCIFFVWLNQFQTWQVSRGMLSSEEGNLAYYRSIFGKTRMSERMLIASDTQILQPDRNCLDSTGVVWSLEETIGGTDAGFFIIAPKTDRALDFRLDDLALNPGDYLRITADAKAMGWSSGRWGMATITTYFTRNEVPYWWRWVRINNKLGNPDWNLYGGVPEVWGEVWYYYLIPDEYREGDPLHVFIANPGHEDVHIRDFRIEYWQKKK